MKNKGQVGEFLAVYGWAILIIIVVIGALFVMGVFTPQPNYSESCKRLCNLTELKFISWDKLGDCIICNCEKVIPLSCRD